MATDRMILAMSIADINHLLTRAFACWVLQGQYKVVSVDWHDRDLSFKVTVEPVQEEDK